MEIGVCEECVYWLGEQWVMNQYGEGIGICKQDGLPTFCSHPCLFCKKEKTS